jgi:murein L,D-transpeptidase YcbB/YkuD
MRRPCSRARRAPFAGFGRAIIVAASLSFAVSPVLAEEPAPAVQDDAGISSAVVDLLANEPTLPLPVRQRRDALTAYYQGHPGALIWVASPARMAELVARLKAADEDGLDPAAYPSGQLAKLASVISDTDARSKAVVELVFSAAFLEFASDLRVGRILPRKVDPNFFLQDKSIDQVAALTGVAAAKSVTAFFAGFQPQSADYAALRETLARYRAIAKAGGWPTVPLGPSLKPGADDPRVPALRARLAVTDGPLGPDSGEHYDDALEAVVQAFQARHGIDPEGVVGKDTVAALNVPVDDRINEIVVAMERWRWMPENLGADHVFVNIAGYELTLVKGGKLADRMAVVVGKPYSRTPVFSDAIKYVELNPYWNVPARIAIKEELPILQRNPAGLGATGFEAVQGGRGVPVTEVDWSRYSASNFPFQLRQGPGPKNALGRAKFVFPNKYDIYLHDTPAHSLFDKSDRAFSHGCVRLSRPLDLAEEVLADVPGWDRARIDQVVADGKNTVVNLVHPLPIHITYLTAWVANGQVNFRNDVYEQDEKLLDALAGRSMTW